MPRSFIFKRAKQLLGTVFGNGSSVISVSATSSSPLLLASSSNNEIKHHDANDNANNNNNGNGNGNTNTNSIQQQQADIFKRDINNIVFLFMLYFLQGIPLGLTASLPFILSSRKVSYFNQGTFSLATWPFSMKLLWAPIVDSIFFKSIGRRKSWLVPIQYLIGIFMFIFADYVHLLLEKKSTNLGNDIYILTAIFFMFTFLAATQDIVVDGWALTILSKENIRWASICNNAGSTTGMLVANSLFLVLDSTEFSNLYIRSALGLSHQPYGLVTLKEFMQVFGIIFVITTTLILLFKKEKNLYYEQALDNELSIMLTFKSLWEILKLAPVQKFLVIMFTSKIAFATSHIRLFKLIENGVSKEILGLMNAPFQLLQILTPLFIGKLVNPNRPLDIFMDIYPIRMFFTILLTVWVFYTPMFKTSDDDYPLYYFLLYIVLNGTYSVIFSTMALSKTSFFTRISDKTIGGTYMTLLNTIANLGNHWPSTLALFLVDMLTYKACSHDLNDDWKAYSPVKKRNFLEFLKTIDSNTCSTEQQSTMCAMNGAKCTVTVDSFYYLTAFTTCIGIGWLVYYKKTVNMLQSLPKTSWKILKQSASKKSFSLNTSF